MFDADLGGRRDPDHRQAARVEAEGGTGSARPHPGHRRKRLPRRRGCGILAGAVQHCAVPLQVPLVIWTLGSREVDVREIVGRGYPLAQRGCVLGRLRPGGPRHDNIRRHLRPGGLYRKAQADLPGLSHCDREHVQDKLLRPERGHGRQEDRRVQQLRTPNNVGMR